MSIARRTRVTQVIASPVGVLVPVGVAMTKGLAVAIHTDNDVQEYAPCGALPEDYGDSFLGFLHMDGVAGQPALVAVGRGSIVEPLVEGDVLLVPDQAVFLSTVAGRVTQTPSFVPTARVLRVGTAISLTQMVLTTDASHTMAG